MKAVFLTIALLATVAKSAQSNQNVYPPLTRETLNGVWEGLIGAHVFLFHISIAPRDSDSYFSEFNLDAKGGNIFRMDSCSVTDGRVRLHFTAVDPLLEKSGVWFEGKGVGDSREGWLDVRWGTDIDEHSSGPPNLRLEKGTWVRRLGEASVRAAKDIKKLRDGKK